MTRAVGVRWMYVYGYSCWQFSGWAAAITTVDGSLMNHCKGYGRSESCSPMTNLECAIFARVFLLTIFFFFASCFSHHMGSPTWLLISICVQPSTSSIVNLTRSVSLLHDHFFRLFFRSNSIVVCSNGWPKLNVWNMYMKRVELGQNVFSLTRPIQLFVSWYDCMFRGGVTFSYIQGTTLRLLDHLHFVIYLCTCPLAGDAVVPRTYRNRIANQRCFVCTLR